MWCLLRTNQACSSYLFLYDWFSLTLTHIKPQPTFYYDPSWFWVLAGLSWVVLKQPFMRTRFDGGRGWSDLWGFLTHTCDVWCWSFLAASSAGAMSWNTWSFHVAWASLQHLSCTPFLATQGSKDEHPKKTKQKLKHPFCPSPGTHIIGPPVTKVSSDTRGEHIASSSGFEEC